MKRKIISLLAVATVLALSFALIGCGDSYQEQTVEFDEWTITITNDEVVYDEDNECDNLVVYFTATNNKDRANAFSDRANMQVKQDGEKLQLMQLKDENGNSLYDFEKWSTQLEPGESIDLVYGSQLISDSPVNFVFSGYSSDIVDAELQFEVADRLAK